MESGVGLTVAKFVPRLDVLLVKVTVVDVEAFRVVDLGSGGVRRVHDIGWVVAALLGDGEGKTTGRIDVTVKNVDKAVAALRAGHASPNDGGDVFIVDPLLNVELARGVNNNDGVRVDSGNLLDELVTVVPCSQVVAVTGVVVDGDVALTRVGLEENERGVGTGCDTLSSRIVKVIEAPVDTRVVLACALLDSLVRADKVGVVRRAATPSDTERAIDATPVGKVVCTLERRTSIGTNHSDLLGLVEREGVVLVLENDGTGCSDFTRDSRVALGHDVDVVLARVILRLESVEIDRRVVLVLPKKVPASQDACGHIVESRFGHGTVLNGHG